MSTRAQLEEGIRLHRSGLLLEAESQYREVLNIEPHQSDALHLLGIISQQRGMPGAAVEFISKAIEANAKSAIFHANLGNALRDLKKFEPAKAAYLKALELDPKLTIAMINLSSLALELNQNEDAWTWANSALKEEPKNPLAVSSAAVAGKRLGRLPDAIRLFEKALELNALDPRTWTNYGNTLLSVNRYSEAITSHRQALQIDPQFAEAWNNLGKTLAESGQFNEALEAYQKAVLIKPNFAEAKINQAFVFLHQKKWIEGFKLYEERKNMPSAFRNTLNIPEWAGEAIRGKSILVYAEQGLGDIIQFIRLLPKLSDAGAQVSFCCPPQLHRLLRTFNLSTVTLVGYDIHAALYDFQISLMSLPAKLSVQETDFTPLDKYLSAEHGLVDRWREKIGKSNALKVGISWQGNPQFTEDRNRSIPLHHFQPLFDLSNIEFYSLQKGFGSEQIEKLGLSSIVKDFTKQIDQDGDSFVDTAALMSLMDVIIAPDTATAHLAGALGRPTWLLLSKVPDWRWSTSGGQEILYKNHRIFRQEKFFDWSSAIASVLAEMKALTKTSKGIGNGN